MANRRCRLRTGCAIALAVVGYAAVIRPRILRWGATTEEVRGPFASGDPIAGAACGSTMAVRIDAPPAAVWPWLVQMGHGRAGWYSWDEIDNSGNVSAHEIHPEWQPISVGDRLPTAPDEKTWWEVETLDNDRFLGLRGRSVRSVGVCPRFFSGSTWTFRLDDAPGGGTRLVVSAMWAVRPAWLEPLANVLLLEPGHWIMQLRQFGNLRRRVERAHHATTGHPPAAG